MERLPRSRRRRRGAQPPRNAGMAASRPPFQNSSRRLKRPVFCPNTAFHRMEHQNLTWRVHTKSRFKSPKNQFSGMRTPLVFPTRGTQAHSQNRPGTWIVRRRRPLRRPDHRRAASSHPPRWSRCWQEVIRPGGFGPIPRRIWLCWCRRVGIRLLRGHPLAKKRGRGGKPSKKCPRVALFSFHPFLERDRPNSLALVPRPVK